jgi:hypothetical protein
MDDLNCPARGVAIVDFASANGKSPARMTLGKVALD